MSHIGGSETRVRCLIEGEEVLNAGHIICCGLKESTASSYTVQGLCLQTSQVRRQPHELWFEFRSDETIKVGSSTVYWLIYFPRGQGPIVR